MAAAIALEQRAFADKRYDRNVNVRGGQRVPTATSLVAISRAALAIVSIRGASEF